MCLSCCLCEITRTPLSGITCTPLIITWHVCPDVCCVCVCVWTHFHAQAHKYVCLFFCLFFWVYLTASGLTQIRVSVYVSICYIFFWAYLTAGGLTLCFSSIQASSFARQPVVGPATRRFRRAFIACVSVRVSRGWVLRYCGWVKVLMSYPYLPCICMCFLCCLCVSVCFCVTVCRCAPADKQTQ